MGLNLATNQYLTAAVSVSAPQPFTFMCWMQRPGGYFSNYESLIGIGDVSEDLAFNNLQVIGSGTRAISFTGFASAGSEDIAYRVTDGEVHFICGVFNGSSITLYYDDLTPITQAWSPNGSVTFDQIAIGRTVSASITEILNGTLEHVAIWNVALNSTQVTDLQALSIAPTDIAGLIAYLPLKSDLTDSVGTLSWTATNLSSPSYTSLGIDYPTEEEEPPVYSGPRFPRWRVNKWLAAMKPPTGGYSEESCTIGNNSTNSYTGTEDNQLDTNTAYNNNGAQTDFAVSYCNDMTHVSLLRFTGLSNIPSNATITSVTLYVYRQGGSGATFNVSLRRLLRNWIEGTQNAADRSNDTPYSSCTIEWGSGNYWTTQLAKEDDTDRSSTITATSSINDTNGYKAFTGAQLIDDIQKIVNGTYANNGWGLYREASSGANFEYQIFTSSEGTNGQRPYLEIEYTVPL